MQQCSQHEWLTTACMQHWMYICNQSNSQRKSIGNQSGQWTGRKWGTLGGRNWRHPGGGGVGFSSNCAHQNLILILLSALSPGSFSYNIVGIGPKRPLGQACTEVSETYFPLHLTGLLISPPQKKIDAAHVSRVFQHSKGKIGELSMYLSFLPTQMFSLHKHTVYHLDSSFGQLHSMVLSIAAA